MQMTNLQQNIAVEIQKIAGELISIKARLTTISEMYTNEGMASLTDAQFQEYAPLAHILATEFQAAGVALVAINTTLGTGPTSNSAKLLKIVEGVPL